MIVLKIIGGIILSILALIILILCVKVRIFAEYSDVDTNVRLQWLFIKIPLYPGKKKEKTGNSEDTSKNAKKTEASAENAESTETTTADSSSDEASSKEVNETSAENTEDSTVKKASTKPDNSLLKLIYSAHGIDGLLLIVRRLFNAVGSFFGGLSRSIVIDELYIDVMCNKNDAASTAIYYGEVCSALFPMLGALVTKYKVRKYDINVYPDYLAKHSSANFAVSLHLYPIYVVGISILLVMRLLFKVLFRLVVKCIPLIKNKQPTAEKSAVSKKANIK